MIMMMTMVTIKGRVKRWRRRTMMMMMIIIKNNVDYITTKYNDK